jgi:hypothetical protein
MLILVFFQENGNESKDSKSADDSQSSAFVCTAEQLEKLAANLAKIDSWKKLIPKLGMAEEALQKLFEEKKATETKGAEKLLSHAFFTL